VGEIGDVVVVVAVQGEVDVGCDAVVAATVISRSPVPEGGRWGVEMTVEEAM
jgi:hypothetical protein